ncbi:MAG: neutral zinc metallopeptidase [Gemmataceae bacterium]
MEYEGREESSNVEDDRGGGGGGFGGRGLVIGGGSIGGTILLVILALVFGVDPRKLAGPGGGPGAVDQPRMSSAEEEKERHFSAIIFGDTERIWGEQFAKMNKTYRKPTLHFYTDEVRSGCGVAESSVGPFYCPADEKVYLDLSFYQDMERKLNAPGDFARAYVIAHEVGHHVQKLLGYSARMEEAIQRGQNKNEMSVRLELQADYLAGVWAHYGQEKYNFLQKGDIESAMNAANQIGDDRLQKKARGTVRPDTFTHGTSKQRVKWFNEGFKTGDIKGAARLFQLNYSEL